MVCKFVAYRCQVFLSTKGSTYRVHWEQRDTLIRESECKIMISLIPLVSMHKLSNQGNRREGRTWGMCFWGGSGLVGAQTLPRRGRPSLVRAKYSRAACTWAWTHRQTHRQTHNAACTSGRNQSLCFFSFSRYIIHLTSLSPTLHFSVLNLTPAWANTTVTL